MVGDREDVSSRILIGGILNSRLIFVDIYIKGKFVIMYFIRELELRTKGGRDEAPIFIDQSLLVIGNPGVRQFAWTTNLAVR